MGPAIGRHFYVTTPSDVIVREAVTSERWQVVARWLHECRPDTQSWVLREASQRAEDVHLAALVATCCPDDQITMLVRGAISRGQWSTVAQLLQRPDISATLTNEALTQASKFDEEDHFTRCILQYCPKPLLAPVLETVVNRGLWEAAARVVRAGVSHSKREWAIGEAARHANEQVVLDFMKFCTADQREMLLAQTTRRGFWRAVTILLATQTDSPKRSEAVERASEHATEDELFKLIPHCLAEELDTVFVLCVIRGLWRLVGILLERGVTENRRQWALDEAYQRAESHEMTDHILSRYSYQRLIPDSAKRRFPDPVQMLLHRGGISDTVLSQVIMEASKSNPIEHFLPLLQDLPEREFLYLISEFINLRMKGKKLIKIVDKREELREEHRLIPFWGRVFVQSLRVMETQPSELNADFKWLTLFHAGLTELCVQRIESLNQQECDNEQVLRCFMKEWTRSAESFCLKESFEVGVTEQVIEELFVQCFYRRHDYGAFIVCIKCLLALQHVSPSVQRLGREKLKEVWEEVRRSVFKTSVEQEDWAVTEAMSDHSLYDDQRGWATVQALDHQQWDVALALSQHGMTDDQLYRIHRQFAKRADWPAVLKLFDNGADLTHVREDLEMANVGRERPPKPEVLLKYNQRIQQLRNLEDRVAQEAESLNLAVKQNNWQVVLYRLRQRSRQRQRSKVLKVAIKRQAWHVVPYLVRMGLSQQDRDDLFPQCISHGQWGIARLLMEKLVDPTYYTASFDVMLKERQWILVAMVMDLNFGVARWKEITQKAMEVREGSMVSHGLTLLEGHLSEEERRQLFFKAYRYQVLLKLVEAKDETGFRHRDYTLREAVWRRQWDIVTHCQQCGADIDAQDGKGDTILHKAAKQCNWEIVQGLLLQGANQNLTDSTGNRVIHRALDVSDWEMVHLLVQFQANLNFRDQNGHNMLYKLIKSTVPSKYFFNPRTTVEEQGRIIDTSLLWSSGVDYGETYRGKNALHVICQAGLPDSFRFLVARGSNPLALTEDGESVLWLAATNQQCPQQLVAECLTLGVSTYEQGITKDNFQTSPFGLSILRQDVVLMSMLYESGSCTNKEVFWHYKNVVKVSARQRSFRLRDRGQAFRESPAVLNLLTKMATQPRTLKSLCRLVVSHHVGVRKKRAKRVAQLPLSDGCKDFVMFRDLIDPEFSHTVGSP